MGLRPSHKTHGLMATDDDKLLGACWTMRRGPKPIYLVDLADRQSLAPGYARSQPEAVAIVQSAYASDGIHGEYKPMPPGSNRSPVSPPCCVDPSERPHNTLIGSLAHSG